MCLMIYHTCAKTANQSRDSCKNGRLGVKLADQVWVSVKMADQV